MIRSLALVLALVFLPASCADEPAPAPTAVPSGSAPPPAAESAPSEAPVVAADPTPPELLAEPEPEPEVEPEPQPRPRRRTEYDPDRGLSGRRKAREGDPRPGRLPSGVTLRGETWHDFGTVDQGTELRHTFVLDSDGEGPLTFQTAKTTCECATQARVLLEGSNGERTELERNDKIPAGTSFLLEVVSSTDSARGPFHSSVVLYTSAPQPVHVELRANVRPVLELDPPGLDLGRITTSESAHGTATVRSTGGQRFRLEQARSTVQHFTAELVAVDPDADGRATAWRVEVRLEPNPLLGERVYRLHLVSDLATGSTTGTALIDFHSLELVATVEVTEAFRAEPQFVTFGRVAPGEAATATVELECLAAVGLPEDTQIRLEAVPGQPFAPAECFAFDLQREEGGHRARLEARLLGLPEGSAGSYGAVLVIDPGIAELPGLKLRLYVSCAPPGER